MVAQLLSLQFLAAFVALDYSIRANMIMINRISSLEVFLAPKARNYLFGAHLSVFLFLRRQKLSLAKHTLDVNFWALRKMLVLGVSFDQCTAAKWAFDLLRCAGVSLEVAVVDKLALRWAIDSYTL